METGVTHPEIRVFRQILAPVKWTPFWGRGISWKAVHTRVCGFIEELLEAELDAALACKHYERPSLSGTAAAAKAPGRLHEEVPADYNDVIYAARLQEIERHAKRRRKGLAVRKNQKSGMRRSLSRQIAHHALKCDCSATPLPISGLGVKIAVGLGGAPCPAGDWRAATRRPRITACRLGHAHSRTVWTDQA